MRDATVNLTLQGYNFLQSNVTNTPGFYVKTGSTLTISAATTDDFLLVIGGLYAAGIGGGHSEQGGTVTINSGRLELYGLNGGAGIGGGFYGDGGTVTINGGEVNATGYTGAAGIGCGTTCRNGGTVTIHGGTVTASGSGYGAGIGLSYFSDKATKGTLTITGGSILRTGNANYESPTTNGTDPVRLVIVDVVDGAGQPAAYAAVSAISIDGLDYEYGITDVKTDKDGKLYLWLPDGIDEDDVSVTISTAKSSNADLSGLELSSGTLEPAFASGTTSYTASVYNDVTSITVTPTTADSKATVTVDGATVVSGTPSEAISLEVGENTITIVVTAEDGTTKTYTVTVTRESAAPGPSDPETPPPAADPVQSEENPGFTVIVDGVPHEQVAESTVTEDNGTTSVTVTIDDSKLKELLAEENDHTVVVISVTSDLDKFAAVLTGEAVKAMENKQAVLEIETPIGSYKLPAADVWIDNLSAQLGEDVALSDIIVNVSIEKSDADTIQVVENAAETGQFTLVVPPIDFTITAAYNGKTVQADKFNSYVEREIPIPDGVDPSRITTAVITEKDGTTRHVPTIVIARNGKFYAVVNSLTNSTYSLIWRNVAFADMEGHWAKSAVNDMASRMVIKGMDETHFHPDAPITRAQFAAIVIRGLGLSENGTTSAFSDVTPGDWYMGAVAKAHEYGIIQGYEDGTFRPNRTVTREEAMAMIARAMQWTGLRTEVSSQDAAAILSSFTDGAEISGWAVHAAAAVVSNGLVQGSNAELHPKDEITRAETAAIVQRLLIQSNLIDQR